MAARWEDGTGRNRFPELQVWRRRSGDAYDRIASTALTATAESPNELYSGTIDPPLQFQSGDLLGMYIPPNADGGARLLVWFGIAAGSTYEFRSNRNAPLSAIILTGLETDSDNDRPFLALEISEYTLSAAVFVVSLSLYWQVLSQIPLSPLLLLALLQTPLSPLLLLALLLLLLLHPHQ